MPVIIEKADWRVWLGEEDGNVRALPADRFQVWPVSQKVNSVKNDRPELLEPSEKPQAEPALL